METQSLGTVGARASQQLPPATLEQIQASLERIVAGTYGLCTVCHARIETERLRAMPEVERCSGCSHR